MRTIVKGVSLTAALLLAVTAFAQDSKKPQDNKDNKIKPALVEDTGRDEAGVHRMEIFNGPLRSVSYVYRGLSASEAQAVRELERAENEGILADDLLALRKQYISGELTFDAQRRFSQEQLYGYSATDSGSGSFSAYRRVGEFGRTGAFFPGWGFGGWGFGGYGMSSGGAVAGGFTSSDSVGLGQGVGDEGVIKNEIARVVASQATPEYAAKVSQGLVSAAARAAAVPVVRDSLGMKAPAGQYVGNVVITRVLDGKSERIEGKVLGEEGDWLILDTKQGKRRLMKNTIVDLLEPKGNN